MSEFFPGGVRPVVELVQDVAEHPVRLFIGRAGARGFALSIARGGARIDFVAAPAFGGR